MARKGRRQRNKNRNIPKPKKFYVYKIINLDTRKYFKIPVGGNFSDGSFCTYFSSDASALTEKSIEIIKKYFPYTKIYLEEAIGPRKWITEF